MSSNPKIILLFSGKRKSGKDYLTEKLLKILGTEIAEIIRISEPIKSAFAKELNLDLAELLSDGPYKEKYRKDMIVWSDQERLKDYGCFCREASKAVTNKPILIVSDIRRKTDIKWFKENFSGRIKTVKIHCDDEVRIQRGWKFQTGVDDVQSECDLDDFTEWTYNIDNNSGTEPHENLLRGISQLTL